MGRTSLPLLALLMFVALILLLPGGAGASEQTGAIKGTVRGPDGTPLVGVGVVAQGPELLGQRAATTREGGSYWLPALPPGRGYQVQFQMEGYKTLVVRDIRISIGRTFPLDVRMDLPTAEESVEVTAGRAAIDTSQTDSGTTVSKEFLQAVPSSRSYQTTAQFAPGVTGGSNPNVRGGASDENAFLLDGVNVTDPVTGTFSFNFPFQAIEEVEIKTGAYAPEYGDALGGIINVRTESGSNDFQSSVTFFGSDGALSPKRDGVYDEYGNVIEGSEYDRTSRSFSLGATVGGPIARDKAWFFGAYEFTLNESTALGVTAPRRFRGHFLFAKLTAAPHPAHRVEVMGFTNPTTIDNTRQAYDVPPETEAQQAQGGFVVRGQWDWFISDQVLWRASYSFQKEYIDVTPMPCTWDPDSPDKKCTGDQAEGAIDFYTPGRIGVGVAEDADNYNRYSFDDRISHAVELSLSAFAPDMAGTHEFKIGAQPRWTSHDWLYGYPGNVRWYDIWETSGDPSSLTNYYWVEYPGQFHTRAMGFTLGAYVQDTWRPIPNLAINYGARYERMRLDNDVGQAIVDTHLVVPRVGLSWDPFKKERTSFWGAFGMFGSGGRLTVSEFVNENGFGYKLYLGDYFDHDSNYSYEQYANQSTRYKYESSTSLTAPRSYDLALGARHALWEKLTVGLEFNRKWFRYLWEDDEVNLIFNEDGSDIVGTQTGIVNDLFRLRTGYYGLRDYWAVILSVRQEWNRNFLLDASLTYSSLQGRTESALTIALDNPTQFPYEYGYLSSDRAWVGKVAAAYFLREGVMDDKPWGTTFGGRFTFSSGSRYDRTYYSSKLSGYGLYRDTLGTYDSLELYWLLHLKVTQDVPIPGAGRLRLSVEANNVFNNRQATGISLTSLNSQGDLDASSRLSPFSVEFGLSYVF